MRLGPVSAVVLIRASDLAPWGDQEVSITVTHSPDPDDPCRATVAVSLPEPPAPAVEDEEEEEPAVDLPIEPPGEPVVRSIETVRGTRVAISRKGSLLVERQGQAWTIPFGTTTGPLVRAVVRAGGKIGEEDALELIRPRAKRGRPIRADPPTYEDRVEYLRKVVFRINKKFKEFSIPIRVSFTSGVVRVCD